jgi:hypothetical protein
MTVRIIVAVAVLLSGLDHIRLWNNGGKHLHIVGPLFLVQGIAAIIVAGLVVFWRHWIAPLLAVALAAGTLIGFAIATLPSGLVGDHEKWVGGTVWVAAITEVVAIIAGLYAYSRERQTAPVQQRAAVRS